MKSKRFSNPKEDVIQLWERIKTTKEYLHKDAKTNEFIQEAIYELYSTDVLEYIELIAYIKSAYRKKHGLESYGETIQDENMQMYDVLLDMLWENIPGCGDFGRFNIRTQTYETRIKEYRDEVARWCSLHPEEVQ